MNAFKRMCMQNQLRKFQEIWTALEEATARYSGESQGATRRVRTLSEWVSRHAPEVEKWALVYDTDGRRYGVMTTNMSEGYNGVLKGTRCLPITAIVDETWSRTVRYFKNRSKAAKARIDKGKEWSESMQRHIDLKIKKFQKHDIRVIDGLRRKYEIRLRRKHVNSHARGDKKHECKLNAGDCSCTCNKPKLLHYPCSHVYKACAHMKQSSTQYVSSYFDIHHLMGTWSAEFFSYGLDMSYKDLWPGEIHWAPNPQLRQQKKGWRHTRRIRNDMDESQSGEARKCTICRTAGHSRKDCPNKPSSSTRD